MKFFIILMMLPVFLTNAAFGTNQEDPKTRPLNNINVDLMGSGSLLSLNYERLFILNQGLFFTVKTGVGVQEEFTLGDRKGDQFLTIPHHLSMNFGKKTAHLEVGVGGTSIIGNTAQNYIIYPLVGLRIQPTFSSKKLVFRLYGNIPHSGFDTEDILFFPIGLSFGYSF